MKNPSIWALLICLAIIPASLYGQCKLDYSNYDVIFEDNFDTYTTIAQVGAKWKFVDEGQLEASSNGCVLTAPNPYQGIGNEYYSPNQVSLQPGGILRLSADRVPEFDDPTGTVDPFDKIITRKIVYVSGKLESKLYKEAGTWNCNPGGVTYGMFEMRCKLPAGIEGNWPSFWLFSGSTEIDVFDNLNPNPARMFQSSVLDWNKINWGRNQTPPIDNVPGASCGTLAIKSNWDDLSTGFNTYTVVWTPTRVTFFVNGREQYTLDDSRVQTYANPAKILVNLAMAKWSTAAHAEMDIDYIKVYKPHGYVSNIANPSGGNTGDYTLPYKTSSEYVNHNVSASAASLPGVNPAPGSVATHAIDPRQVFYRGTDDRMYYAYKGLDNQWSIMVMPVASANEMVKGDVTFNPATGAWTYRGYDNLVQYYGYWNGWYHSYADYTHTVKDAPGSLTAAANGDVFYIDQQNKICRFAQGTNAYERLPFDYSNPASLAMGDIKVVAGNSSVIYKGMDNRLQQFWPDGNHFYNHAWIDYYWNTQAYTVSSKPSSITVTDNGRIFYIGVDDLIHQFAYVNGNWTNIPITYNYGNPSLGYLDADKAKGGIIWDATHNQVIYGAYDGRLQYFRENGSSWYHQWLDDYWNTYDFQTFHSIPQEANYYPSFAINNTGAVFYCDKDNHLRYFRYEACETLNPACYDFNLAHSTTLLRTSGVATAVKSDARATKLAIYPNPAQEEITIELPQDLSLSTGVKFDLYSAEGKQVRSGTIAASKFRIDLATLPQGIYMLKVVVGKQSFNQKVVKY